MYYVKTPVIPMRKEPNHRSEVISQAYCSEKVLLLEEKEDWAFIATDVDSYNGWILKDALVQRNEPFHSLCATIDRCAAHVYDQEDTISGPIATLPFETKIEVLSQKSEESRWLAILLIDGQKGFIQRGDISFKNQLKTKEEILSFSLRFLNLPYTWGGRSSFGYDCSGFTQMLYRQMGLFIPRDAQEQISWAGFVPTQEINAGDLVFWGRSDKEIYHVGMYLGHHRFIHATVAENAPYLRVSYLSDPEWNGKGRWPYRAARTLKT